MRTRPQISFVFFGFDVRIHFLRRLERKTSLYLFITLCRLPEETGNMKDLMATL